MGVSHMALNCVVIAALSAEGFPAVQPGVRNSTLQYVHRLVSQREVFSRNAFGSEEHWWQHLDQEALNPLRLTTSERSGEMLWRVLILTRFQPGDLGLPTLF